MNGKQLLIDTEEMFHTTKPTYQQLNYVMTMSDPVIYVMAHHTVKGHPVTFDVPNFDQSKAMCHRPWQKEILRCTCNPNIKDVTIMKSRQLGLSEVGVETLLYLMDVLSSSSPKFMYLFPTYGQVVDFLKSRIRTELQNKYYNSLLDKNNNSLQQFTFRNSTAFFRTGKKASAVEGVDTDCLLMDEYERYAGTSAEESALESMSSSKYGLIRRWSTPSVPDYGIDQRYEESDQRMWFIKCEHCGKYQVLNFHDNIKVVNPDQIDHQSRQAKPGACEYVCKYCGKPLDASRWYNGQWIAKYPNEGKPVGFFISQLDAVWISADKIYTKYMNADSLEDFNKYTLGTPFKSQSVQFNPDDVYHHVRSYLPHPVRHYGDSELKYDHITFGIDWGQHWHHVVIIGMTARGKWDVINLVRIPNLTGTDNLGKDVHEVKLLIQRYKPDIVCVDDGYNGQRLARLQDFFPDVVYGVNTNSSTSNGNPAAPFNVNSLQVKIDKVTQTKITLDLIKSGRLGFYYPDKNLGIFVNHWGHVIIRDEVDENTNQMVEKYSRNGPDHFASACVYAVVAMREVTKRLQTGNAEQIKYLGGLNVTNDNREFRTGHPENDKTDIKPIR